MKPARIAAALCTIAFAAPLAASAQAPAEHHPICIQTYLIDHTQVVDDNTILFYLRGGKIYKNTLTSRCVGLRLSEGDGFVYDAQNNEICENLQTIKLRHNGEVCSLGAFTPYTPAPAGAPPGR